MCLDGRKHPHELPLKAGAPCAKHTPERAIGAQIAHQPPVFHGGHTKAIGQALQLRHRGFLQGAYRCAFIIQLFFCKANRLCRVAEFKRNNIQFVFLQIIFGGFISCVSSCNTFSNNHAAWRSPPLNIFICILPYQSQKHKKKQPEPSSCFSFTAHQASRSSSWSAA